MRSTIIGAVLVSGLALTGCVPSEEPSDMPPAPGTPPADAPQHSEQPSTSDAHHAPSSGVHQPEASTEPPGTEQHAGH